MAKTVLVHTCYAIADGQARPGLCACYQKVTPAVAKRMIGENIAEWVITQGNRTIHNAICIIGGSSRRTPRAATIDAKHITRAYIGRNLEERVRIDEYGDLSRKVILDMVQHIPASEFDKNKNESLNVPVLQFIGDNRTPGGVSEEKE